ncbi:hypothetical protein [Streptomyces sp. NPDC093598]|uniref:hypothetical protein n=1 Tax=Streptomyces sp. NPDC093598 TaxID=3366046 RepID=UPI0037F8277E
MQILELPTEHHGDDMITPFVLVIDEVDTDPDGQVMMKAADWEATRERLGARAILIFEETVTIPANEVSP